MKWGMGIIVAAIFLMGVLALVRFFSSGAELYREQKKVLEAKDQLQKLVLITRHTYAERAPKNGADIWRDIGRNGPMMDPWGSAYSLEVVEERYQKQFFWRSAGPDRALRSADDLLEPFIFDIEKESTNPFPLRDAK